jgi:hypothetical protein
LNFEYEKARERFFLKAHPTLSPLEKAYATPFPRKGDKEGLKRKANKYAKEFLKTCS